FQLAGTGHAAALAHAEPAVAVARDEAVHGVAEEARHDDERVEERPREAEEARDPERRAGPGVNPAVLDEKQGLRRALAWHAVRREQPLPGLRLVRGEQDAAAPIVIEDELRRAVAEVANPVEDHHRLVGRGPHARRSMARQ